MIPSFYGYLALALLTGLTLWSIAGSQLAAWTQSRALFAGLLGLTIVAAHAPTLGISQAMPNPDEAQLLAGALTLRSHFAPWLSVDLSTAGPLSVLPFLIAPASFLTARWCAALCAALAVTGCWLALTRPRNDALARVAALPVAAFFVFMQDVDLFQFSTEPVAVVLLTLSVCVWMAATAGGDTPLSAGAACALGLGLGAAIMAKLQSAPCAAWLAASTGSLMLADARQPWRRRFETGAALAAGGLAIPLGFVGLAAIQGVLPDLLSSYGQNNLDYISRMETSATGYQPSLVWGLNYLLKPAGAVLLLGLLFAPAYTAAERRTALVAVGWLATAIVAVVLPGRGFHHYWQLVFGPMVLALGSTLVPAGRWLAARWPAAPGWQRWGRLGLVPLLLALPVIHRFSSSRDEALTRTLAGITPVQAAGEKLRSLAAPGDMLTVWGWRAELYVQSGLPQGTREAHTQWLIQEIPQRDYYRQRFLRDLARTKPRFIADSTGPRDFAYLDRAKSGHEIFPAFAEIVSRQYDYLGEFQDVRLYLRHDR